MIRLSPETYEQIAAVSHQAARRGDYRPIPGNLDSSLSAALRRQGVDRLYSHQARSLELVREGRNVVITTASASGKSLCFNLPVLDELAAGGKARALYIYPTKALAQDQIRQIQGLELSGVRPGIYDRDTPSDHR
ncbi:MAG TPA: DEAD/DEAH box helicase, partial [Actinobacteria bacterium]|nr:DEAD/DEAH box helicase [Actinomycetota bacterium]